MIVFAFMVLCVSMLSAVTEQTIPENYNSTWYLHIHGDVDTPYGIAKLNEDGTPVLDEHGNPVIAIEMRSVSFVFLFRLMVDENTGATSCSVLKWRDSYNEKGEREYDFVPFDGIKSIVAFTTADGKRKGIIAFECEFENRGLGLAPIKCMCYGTIDTKVEKDTKKKVVRGCIKNGKIAGYNEGGDGVAFASTDVKGESAFKGFGLNPAFPATGRFSGDVYQYLNDYQISVLVGIKPDHEYDDITLRFKGL